MLSIILPTLNEENCLPRLLESIKRQNFNEAYEIIVADAGSEDGTVKIAEGYECKVVTGGLLAKGRNEGAKVARGDLLLYLDADAVLPELFLEKALFEFRKRNLGIASSSLMPITGNIFFKASFNFLYNWPARFLENVFPYASNFILVKKEIHDRLGGFDEKIEIAEDHAYARKAAKITKYGFLRKVKVLFSPRRYESDGWLTTAIKYYFCNLYNIFIGEVSSNIFCYKCGEFKERKKISKNKKLILDSLKFPLYVPWAVIWVVIGLVTWLMIFFIFTPKLILSKINICQKFI